MSSTDPEELVESVSLYTPRPVLFHGYVWPFTFLYVGWAIIWGTWLDPESSFEAGMIGLAAILVLQTLVYLFCHWSVHVCAYLTCSHVCSSIFAVSRCATKSCNNLQFELN